MNIPSEVSITKTNKIEFADKTRSFLVWYFIVSSLIVLGGLIFGYSGYSKLEEAKKIKSQIKSVEINQMLKPFERMIQKDSEGWYYLEFKDPIKSDIQRHTDIEIMKDNNGKYNRKARVYIGKK